MPEWCLCPTLFITSLQAQTRQALAPVTGSTGANAACDGDETV